MVQNMNVIIKLKKEIDESSRSRGLEKVESSNPNSSFLTKVNYHMLCKAFQIAPDKIIS